MLSLIGLKKDREAMKSLHDIVDVLKGVSSAQLHLYQAQEKDLNFHKYMEDFFRILNLQYIVHPFLKELAKPPTAVVMVTSDESFTAGINSVVIGDALARYEEGDELIALGTRAIGVLETRNVKFTSFSEKVDEDDYFPISKSLVDYLAGKYVKGQLGRVDFVYPRFISLSKQTVVRFNMLPFHPAKVIKGTENLPRGAIIEPSLYQVADILVRMWMLGRIQDIFWDAKVAYTAGRILRLEGSSQELTRVEGSLRFKYFKLVHAINDKRIREIFSSRLKRESS